MDYNEKYLKYKAKYLKLKSIEKQQMSMFNMSGGGNANKPTVYLFKAEWCPHCVNFKPTWNDIQKNMSSKVEFVTYDADKNKNEIKQFNIEGFPTIILKKEDKAIEYVGPRDINSVKEFIEQYN